MVWCSSYSVCPLNIAFAKHSHKLPSNHTTAIPSILRMGKPISPQSRIGWWRTPTGTIGILITTIIILGIITYTTIPSHQGTNPHMMPSTVHVGNEVELAADSGVHTRLDAIDPQEIDASSTRIETFPIQIWQYQSHCGGARLTHENESRLRHGHPANWKRLYIKRGEVNSEDEPVLLSVVADSHGIAHVPFYPRVFGELSAPKEFKPATVHTLQDLDEARVRHLPIAPATLLALPSSYPGATYCLIDLEGDFEQKSMVAQHKIDYTKGVESHLHIDYECMEAKWRRCLFVMHLDDLVALKPQPAKQPFIRQHTVHPTEPVIPDHPMAIIELHEHCYGRGECERWTGPMPK